MSKNLVIVESPAKAKTIEKYLGSAFIVKSSYGHIRDLPKKGINIDTENNFAPTYEISPDKKKIVAELRKAAAGKEVWLATDEDREGEAIAWHLCHALKLPVDKTKRIVFHEITKTAIEKAIKSPRTIHEHLVDAQQARRILDRLVGYELSPVLWRKVRTGLSAGRVQSVAVRLIVEREREINEFNPVVTFKVVAELNANSSQFSAELVDKIKDLSGARKVLLDCNNQDFTVVELTTRPSMRNPAAPFITSSLQQEAARRLGYGVSQTMRLAQRLYENGHITYMRTDSSILSDFALDAAKKYINKEFGSQYYTYRQYASKAARAQEAHEAIRPTDFSVKQTGTDLGESKLYHLIWQRALASQMSPAKIEKTEIKINPGNLPHVFIAKGEILKFDGFIKVYGGGKEDQLLPDIKKGQVLSLEKLTAKQTYGRSPARYSEASLVKKLEELSIGRPSTYAPTISTVQKREYVEKKDLEGQERSIKMLELKGGEVVESDETEQYGADRSKLIPTPLAEITTDFLVKYFAPIVDYDFTAKAEEEFDEIAAGERKWQDSIQEFYKNFHPLIGKTDKVSRQETSKARLLGEDPKSKKPIYVRFGRFGPMLQRGETDESEIKPDFAPIPAGITMDNVTLEQALRMFQLPKKVGTTDDGKEITANIGRFGPYIQIEKLFVSIKPKDPFSITESEARILYIDKLKKEAEKHIKDLGGGIKIQKGPYGPYVTDGKRNAAIPKKVNPVDITLEAAIQLLNEAPSKKKRFKKGRRK